MGGMPWFRVFEVTAIGMFALSSNNVARRALLAAQSSTSAVCASALTMLVGGPTCGRWIGSCQRDRFSHGAALRFAGHADRAIGINCRPLASQRSTRL